MVVIVLGWLVSVMGWMFGWLLVCLDGCLDGCYCVGMVG
jgi:hypothetical protein